MPRAPKQCAWPTCDEPTHQRHCPTHAAQAGRFRDLRRATPAERGYDHAHRMERQRWAPLVARGTVTCWRCGRLIAPETDWDIGHDDHDRSITRGPEHARGCNRAEAGKRK